MASFQDKEIERLFDRIGKNVEFKMASDHSSLVEELSTAALEKDILLSRCRDFDKLGISPIYNTKLVQEYISETESSIYRQYVRHYIPFVAPKMRETFKPALNVVINWVKDNLLKLTVTGLEQAVMQYEGLEGFQTLYSVDWVTIIQELDERFKILHPKGWDGVIENDDLVAKVSEIATDIIYYKGLDKEINTNFERIKRQNGEEYAIEISSRLKNSAFFTEVKNRGYFLKPEIETLHEIFPSFICPIETCSEGFFGETLDSCTKKQSEMISEMLMDLPPVKTEDLPEDSITFEAFLRYIVSELT